MKTKRFKHKWWQHFFFKYKVIEHENSFTEYSRLRNWAIISLYLLTIIFSPIIVAVVFFKEIKTAFFFPNGKNGRTEEYTIYKKECKEYEN